jgi:hypothetical protein
MTIRVVVGVALASCAALACPLVAHAQAAGTSLAAPQQDEAVVGTVQIVKGAAFILRGGQRLPAGRGTRLYQQDVIRTEKGGAIGLVLRDETAVSLGPSSELAVREFAYRPSEGVFASVLSFVRGTMVYIAGRIAKLAPSAIRVETPVGVAAARGTKFLVAVPE